MAVMHDPRRADTLPGLLALLGLDRRVQVVRDRHRNLWDTAERSWQAMDLTGTHHMVLQDDVLPCRDFLAGATKALEAVPDKIVSFFSSRRIIQTALARGSSWATMGSLSMAQAVAMPVSVALDWLTWCDDNVDRRYRHDDGRMSLYALSTGLQFWLTAPSLVEHVGFDRSLQGYRAKTPSGQLRVAKVFIGDDPDATPLEIDWTVGRVPVPHESGTSLSAYKDWRISSPAAVKPPR